MQIYKSGDVARMLHVSNKKLAELFFDKSGGEVCPHDQIPGFRIPGSQDRRFEEADVLAFLRRHGMPIPAALRREPCGLYVGDDENVTAVLRINGLTLHDVSQPFDAGWQCAHFTPQVMIVDFDRIPVEAAQTLCEVVKKRYGDSISLVALMLDVVVLSRSPVFDHRFQKPLGVDAVNRITDYFTEAREAA